jgi:hypothetical protein
MLWCLSAGERALWCLAVGERALWCLAAGERALWCLAGDEDRRSSGGGGLTQAGEGQGRW